MNQIDAYVHQYWEQGCISVPNVLDAHSVAILKNRIRDWSGLRGPAYYRLQNPTEVAGPFFDLAFKSPILNLVTALIGPNVTFHHGKVHRGTPTPGWHRDICSYPHTNSRLLACEFYLDDVDESHGALKVVSGSHQVFGAGVLPMNILGRSVDNSAMVESENIITLKMKAGGVSIHHCLALHNVIPTSGLRDRDVIIYVYCAAEATMLVPDTTGCVHYRKLVAGKDARYVTVDSSAFVFSEKCLGEDGLLRSDRRELGMRMRGISISMM